MYSPKVTAPKDIMDEDPTSILRVFGDFNSRVRCSFGANPNAYEKYEFLRPGRHDVC